MFILLIIYLTVLFVVFCFCISVSKKIQGERCLAREYKTNVLGRSECFWSYPLLNSGYESISHWFVCAFQRDGMRKQVTSIYLLGR